MASFPIEARGQRHQRLCGRAAAQTKSQIFNRRDLPCVFIIISFCSPPHSARWCKSILRQSWPWSRRGPQASLRRSFTDVVWHARRREKQLETFAPRTRTRPSGHCAAMRRSTRCDSSHAQERASDRSRLRPDKSQVAAAGRIEQKGGLETLSRSSDAAFCVSPPRVSPELRWQYFLARMVSGAPSLLTSSVSDEASRSAPMHRHVACSPSLAYHGRLKHPLSPRRTPSSNITAPAKSP